MNSQNKYFLLFLFATLALVFCDNLDYENDDATEVHIGEIKSVFNDSDYLLNFIKEPANYTKKTTGSLLKLKCEVSLSKYLNNTLVTTLRSEDVQNTTEILLRKVKIRWLKNEAPIITDKNRISIKRSDGNGTVSSTLRIKNLEILDKAFYCCTAAIGKRSIRSLNAQVDVRDQLEGEDGDIPAYESLYTKSQNDPSTTYASGVTNVFSNNGYGFTNQGISPSVQSNKEDEIVDVTSRVSNVNVLSKNIDYPKANPSQGICQIYTGTACAEFLSKRYVFIPYPVTQTALEDKLTGALKVVNHSNEISSNCVGYAIPSLCFSTFPVCRTPNETNTRFFEHFDEFIESTNKIQKNTARSSWDDLEDDSEFKVHFENMPPGGLPAHLTPNLKTPPSRVYTSDGFTFESRVKRQSSANIEFRINTKTKKITSEPLYPTYDKHMQESNRDFSLSRASIPLQRVCKEDCEILEDELCQTEYAIAKRHPEIGQTLTLEECRDLPIVSPDCLEIGIERHIGTDTCYWETGVYYRGNTNISTSGLPCLHWSLQFIYKMANHPELTGKHNFCRNPGGQESQPWCYVITETKGQVRQLCDIPKCSRTIWIYIISSMVGVSVLFAGCTILICCRQRNSKSNTAAIRNINLPNADKNIYGNSRLNSPIELTDLLTQNTNSRTNGISRVPQFSLTQIKFIEELGEGAFGKVYKGELIRDGEKIFVAVKALKENASQKTQQDFKREIELISELRHENIVCILGVVLKEEPLCMLFEFMAKGDLHEFLMETAPPEGSGLSPTQFLMIAQHIASGMEYLAAHHYVHRDLAARNCLVADNLVVKISDFGLSRDIYSSDYYRVQSKSLLPVRWMPPESILYGKFTTESDVWSYGVVLWEIYSFGLQPYYGYSNQEVISMVRSRQLLQCPTDCPRAVYGLMKECWHQTSSKRPNFTTITQRLLAWIRPNSNLHYDTTSDSSGAASSQRQPPSIGDPRERIPLIGNHSSSNGSLAGSMPRKLSAAGSVRSHTSGRLMMSSSDVTSGSDICESNIKMKKSSCGSLLESGERLSQKETVVKIPTMSQPFDI